MYPKDFVIRTGTIFALVMLMLFFAVKVQGQQILTFGWNPSPDTNVVGYLIDYGTVSGVYSSEMDTGSNSMVTISNFDAGTTYYIVVIAYNADGLESPPSGELAVTIPGRVFIALGTNPGDPLRVMFPVGPGHWYELQSALTPGAWTTIWQTPMPQGFFTAEYDDPVGTDPQRFYRLILH